MKKPSFFLEIVNGDPVVSVHQNADEVIQKLKASSNECYAFIRPVPSKAKSNPKGLVLRDDSPAPAIDEIVIEKSPEQPEIETDDETAEAIAELIETAQGDARKKDVKEARERLDALGIEY